MFLDLYKAVRRSNRFQPKLGWLEQDRAYIIAEKYFPRFKNAFVALSRGFIDDDVYEKIKTTYNKGATIYDIYLQIPLFVEGAFEQEKVWEKFFNKINIIYKDVILESGEKEVKQLNEKLKTNLKFVVDGEELDSKIEIIQKAKKIPVVPVNRYSLDWIKKRSLDLIKEGITNTQKKTIRNIFEYSFERGFRGKELVEELKANIGLTDREYLAVINRRKLHFAQGMKRQQVNELVEKYQKKLLTVRAERIARTETIAAQAHGRNTAWRLAKELGQIDDVVRIWVAPPPSANPNRPCEICLELEGKMAKIGEPYESLFVGFIDNPPVHPGCRCTETLVKRGG